MTEHDEVLTQLEKQNAARIGNLETTVAELRAELRESIAAMPSRIVEMLDQRHPSTRSSQHVAWAFGVMLTLLGACAWNFFASDTQQSHELDHHTGDGHPHSVLAIVTALTAKHEALENLVASNVRLIEKAMDLTTENRIEDATKHGQYEARLNGIETMLDLAWKVQHQPSNLPSNNPHVEQE